MIQFGLKKNLPSGVLYNSQIGNLIFVCGLVFKVSSLPGIAAEYMHSSLLWSYLFMAVLDMFPLVFAYLFIRLEGDDFLISVNSRLYKIALFIMILYILMKSIICFAFASYYLTNDLFTKVSPVLMIVAYMVPIVYLGLKGIKTIARISEIIMPIAFTVLLLNFVFLDTNMDFGRNLPVFAVEPKDFFINSFRFGSWLGDATPLIFVKMKKKKMPYIGINTFLLLVIILLTAFFGVSMYGDALPSVSNLLIRIASFNQFSTEIGRMEWSALFIVLTFVIITLAYFQWSTIACCRRVFGTELPMKILFPAILLTAVLASPSIEAIKDLAVSPLGFVMFGLSMGGPIAITLLYVIAKHRFKKKGGVIPPALQTKTSAVLCGEGARKTGDFPSSTIQTDGGDANKAQSTNGQNSRVDTALNVSSQNNAAQTTAAQNNPQSDAENQSTLEGSADAAAGESADMDTDNTNSANSNSNGAENKAGAANNNTDCVNCGNAEPGFAGSVKDVASGSAENGKGTAREISDAAQELPPDLLTLGDSD